MNPKYEMLSKPKTAFTLILVIYVLCFPLAVVEYLGHLLIENVDATECSDNETVSIYYFNGYSEWFTDNDYMGYKLFHGTEGVVSKVRISTSEMSLIFYFSYFHVSFFRFSPLFLLLKFENLKSRESTCRWQSRTLETPRNSSSTSH